MPMFDRKLASNDRGTLLVPFFEDFESRRPRWKPARTKELAAGEVQSVGEVVGEFLPGESPEVMAHDGSFYIGIPFSRRSNSLVFNTIKYS